MSQPFAYGKSIVQPIQVFAGPETPVAIHSLVSARIYRDPPSDAQKLDSAGALAGFEEKITAFSASDTTDLVYTLTFAAIDDPDQSSGSLYDRWHIVANVRLEAGAQEQVIYEEVLLWRVTGLFSQLDVDEDDVYEVEEEIETILGDTLTREKLNRAKERVRKRLRSRSLDRNKVEEADLGEAVVYLAASMCLRDMATEGNQDYARKADYYAAEYENIWGGLKLGYQETENAAIEPTDKVTPIKRLRVRI